MKEKLLPVNWRVDILDNVASITRLAGAEYSDLWNEDENGEVIAIRGFNIGKNKLVLDNYSKISKELSSRLIRSKLFIGDIVFPCVGTIGNACVIKENDKYHINQNIAKITPNNDMDSEYLCQFLMSDNTKKEIQKFNATTSQPNVLVGSLRKFTIIVPSLREQQKIAEILSTWDSAIEKQEQLIEKKKEFKKGLMQKLLSGEARFKEFNDKWIKVHISDIANQVSDINKNNKNYTVLSCTKYDGLVESLKYFGKQMFSDDISKYKLVKKNEFAYATNHIEEGSIGLQKICDTGLVSPMYTVFTTNDKMVDNDFMFYLLKTDKYISIYKSRMSASVDRRGSLRWPEFSKIKLNLPELEEQKKIVEILSNADKEIELLQKELEALKLQKKGLMQRLLIGEVRVKI